MPQLSAWLEMDQMADFSEDMLMDALSKAAQEVLQRRKQEYEIWSKGKSTWNAIHNIIINRIIYNGSWWC